MACILDPGTDFGVRRWRTRTRLHVPIEIGDSPRFRVGSPGEARNEMQMEMAGSIPEGNRVHPVTAWKFMHALTALGKSCNNSRRFCRSN